VPPLLKFAGFPVVIPTERCLSSDKDSPRREHFSPNSSFESEVGVQEADMLYPIEYYEVQMADRALLLRIGAKCANCSACHEAQYLMTMKSWLVELEKEGAGERYPTRLSHAAPQHP
jgi:hypothetical protein